MGITAYSPCPGGLDKKVKFCCADLVHELDKIERMAESDQNAGCLELVERLDRKYPQRPCLLSAKAMLLANLDRGEDSSAALSEMLKVTPENPLALAQSSLAESATGNAKQAVELMQQAVVHSGRNVQSIIASWFGELGRTLYLTGHPISAIQHLLTHQLAAQDGDNVYAQDLASICGSGTVPSLLKELQRLRPAPSDAPWAERFESACKLARTLRWSKSAEQFELLSQEVPDAPAVWWNLATVLGWLADESAAAKAWHRFAELDVPLDERVDAEAVALLLDGFTHTEVHEQVALVYELDSIDELEQSFASDPRSRKLFVDPTRISEREGPPPKALFHISDKQFPDSHEEVKREDVPSIIASVLLHGKQTDRAARCQVQLMRDESFDRHLEIIQQIAGGKLGNKVEEKNVRDVNVLRHVLSISWNLPPEFPEDVAVRLRREEMEIRLHKRLSEIPLKLFDGETIAAAAANPGNMCRVLAVLQIIEQVYLPNFDESDLNGLRTQLGLPTTELAELSEQELAQASTAKLNRARLDTLSSSTLDRLVARAGRVSNRRLLKKLAREVVRRDDWDGVFTKSSAFGVLAASSVVRSESLDYLKKAQQAADAAGESSAPWDLEELTLRVLNAETDELEALINHIQDTHGHEPGVMRQLLSMLVEFGIVRLDSLPEGPIPFESTRIQLKTPAKKPDKIWTPSSDLPQGQKAAIWVPGSD